MVTIEISSDDIRLIEVNGGKIVKWASRPLPHGVFAEDIVSDPKALGDAIRSLMASKGIKNKSVIASVSGVYSLSRIVAISVAPEQPVTEKAIIEASEDVMPVSPDEIYLSWQTLPAGDGQHQALVLGVPREMIDGEIRALKSAGVDPRVLDLKTLALARAVNRPDAIVLNIDAASYDFVILTSNIPEILRTTAWQPSALAADERAEQLISAIEITAAYYNTRHPDSPLDQATPLFITGHLSRDTALTGLIRDGLVFPVEPLAPPLQYPDEFPVSEYAVNIGLAMKASASPKLNLNLRLLMARKGPAAYDEATRRSVPDLNLLPQVYKPWRPSARQVLSTLAIIAIIGMLIPSYRTTTEQMRDTATVRQRYEAVNTTLVKRRAEVASREPLQQSIDQYKSVVAMGGGFVDDFAAIRQMADELGVTISAITHSGDQIAFSCDAPDYTTFRKFVDALENNGRFTVAAVPPEGYPFIKGGAITLKPIK